MLLLVWFALGVSVVLTTVGAVVFFRRGLELWRDLKRVRLAVTLKLEGLAYRAEELSTRMAAVPARAPAVEEEVGRLRRSLAELGVLTAALRDVRDAFGRVTAVYPRK
jgi:hypothetical protein